LVNEVQQKKVKRALNAFYNFFGHTHITCLVTTSLLPLLISYIFLYLIILFIIYLIFYICFNNESFWAICRTGNISPGTHFFAFQIWNCVYCIYIINLSYKSLGKLNVCRWYIIIFLCLVSFHVSEFKEDILFKCADSSIPKSWSSLWWPKYFSSLIMYTRPHSQGSWALKMMKKFLECFHLSFGHLLLLLSSNMFSLSCLLMIMEKVQSSIIDVCTFGVCLFSSLSQLNYFYNHIIIHPKFI